ncbi:MAG: hypothetical protein WB555_04755, partial [Candidatus Korobacteraceae bacterium]
EVAAEFDRIHSVHRAMEVGALHNILAPKTLRPYLIHAIERGLAKAERANAARLREDEAEVALQAP